MAAGEEPSGVLELLIFNELPDQFPAWIFLVIIRIRRLDGAGQESPALQIHQIRRHHDELAREVDVQHFEGVDVGNILLGDALDIHVQHIQLLLPDQVEQEVERTFEDIEFNFVGVFHRQI